MRQRPLPAMQWRLRCAQAAIGFQRAPLPHAEFVAVAPPLPQTRPQRLRIRPDTPAPWLCGTTQNRANRALRLLCRIQQDHHRGDHRRSSPTHPKARRQAGRRPMSPRCALGMCRRLRSPTDPQSRPYAQLVSVGPVLRAAWRLAGRDRPAPIPTEWQSHPPSNRCWTDHVRVRTCSSARMPQNRCESPPVVQPDKNPTASRRHLRKGSGPSKQPKRFDKEGNGSRARPAFSKERY